VLQVSASAPDVVVVEDVWGEPLDQLSRQLAVRRTPGAGSPEELPGLLRGARAVVVRNRTQISRGVLEASPTLQLVARAGVGLDNIDVAAADDLGVVVVAPTGANAVSVAEHTLGLALALARRLVVLDRATRRGGWDRVPGRELAGRCWGVVGAGATGLATARLARALGMTVVAYDPYLAVDRPEVTELGLRLMDLRQLATAADVVSCHLPATSETTGLLDATFFARMRADALLVNVGRGEVVVEGALVDALVAGELAGVALDVRATEPPVPGRLETLDNVLLTPHVAGITTESQRRILEILAADTLSVLTGGTASHAVGTATTARS
jgi:D-3-phosphoglycerate dehydrogenase/(S)-sulfolactate dehydrogenase